MRIDKLLWHLRLTRSRSLAQTLIAAGHVRVNGNRVEKPSAEVKIGDAITLPHGESALAIRVLALPSQRGPAAAAQGCYRII